MLLGRTTGKGCESNACSHVNVRKMIRGWVTDQAAQNSIMGNLQEYAKEFVRQCESQQLILVNVSQ